MSNEKPEAIELADHFDNWATTFGEPPSGSRSRGAAELRRQHARIQELEAMLEAVGAGGVSAQRVTQGKDHFAQGSKMVAAQEPFGYFKAEPFGWRDCAETDEGAIALYEAPQPQADALDAARWSEIGKSIERACAELPEDFEINIHLESGAGTASLIYPSGAECEDFPHDDGFAGVMNAAIDAAIEGASA